MKALLPKSRQIDPKSARFRLRVAHSALHRYGVFALEEIPRNRRVIEYTGKCLRYEDAVKIGTPNDTYIVAMNSGWCVDGDRAGAVLNSSTIPASQTCAGGASRPSASTRLSLRRIASGEELTVSYRYAIKIRRNLCCRLPCSRVGSHVATGSTLAATGEAPSAWGIEGAVRGNAGPNAARVASDRHMRQRSQPIIERRELVLDNFYHRNSPVPL